LINRKKYTPVRNITTKGKLLVSFLRSVFHFRSFIGGKDWESEMPGHHEDPLYMNTKELIHFAHKYYFRAITSAGDKSFLPELFHFNAGGINLPEKFQAEKSITLSAGGDLMPYYCINKSTCAQLWDECGEFFFDADLVTANLETPVNINKKVSLVPEVMLKNMYFNSNTEMFDVFSGNGKYKGYDVLSVANNHSLDQGEEGLMQTLNFLEEKNIPYCGAAKQKDLIHNFPIIDKNGIKIAFLAATFSLNASTANPGSEWMVNHLQLNTVNPDITLLINQARIAREKGADLIVAHLHMGLAYQPYPSPRTVTTIHHICEQTGIDIILGGHPHNPQPMEFYSFKDPFTDKQKQSFIIYSLGDFVAYDIFKWCHLPAMLKFTISKNQQGTYITDLKIKMAYMQASIEKGEVKALQLRDYKELAANRSALDSDSLKEFNELEKFANVFLLPGNIEKFLV